LELYWLLATEYKIWEVPLSMEPPRTLLTTNTVNTRPAIGKRLLMKLSFRIPLMYVAKKLMSK
jgi:hypothetical protein